jgi:GTP-binding protein
MRPPSFIIFGNKADAVPTSYQRYLINSMRETFDMPGTPIRLWMRTGKNPYADKE